MDRALVSVARQAGVSGMVAKAAEGEVRLATFNARAQTIALNRMKHTTEKNMAPEDETGAEGNARYERIGKASAKTIKNMLAGTALGGQVQGRGS